MTPPPHSDAFLYCAVLGFLGVLAHLHWVLGMGLFSGGLFGILRHFKVRAAKKVSWGVFGMLIGVLYLIEVYLVAHGAIRT